MDRAKRYSPEQIVVKLREHWVLNIVDKFTRRCIGCDVDRNIGAGDAPLIDE